MENAVRAAILRHTAKQQGIRQVVLAASAKTTQPTVVRVLEGRKSAALDAIVVALGLSPATLAPLWSRCYQRAQLIAQGVMGPPLLFAVKELRSYPGATEAVATLAVALELGPVKSG
jgi:hypothetical protein